MLQRISEKTANRLCCLVVGAAGVGKTSLIRTIVGQYYDTKKKEWLPSGFNPEKVLILSAESGLLCVKDLIDKKVIDGFEIFNIQDFQEAQNYCMSQEFMKNGYQWVFIDSLTEISTRCSEFIENSGNDGYKLWQKYNKDITSVIKSFRDMQNVNVVFTCLEEYTKNSDGISRLSVAMQGTQIKSRLSSYFDEVFYMDRQNKSTGIETLFSTKNPIGMAKDRSGKLADYEYPNLLNIKKKILG